MKKVIIIGATSGIGKELAKLYIAQGDTVGITGRREEKLIDFKNDNPDAAVYYKRMDVQEKNCVELLEELINEMEYADAIIYCSGVGAQNLELLPDIEMDTIMTNAVGFTAIVDFAFNYFKKRTYGHIIAISSIAGTKALRQSPAYSASKRFQSHYMSCLAQMAYNEKLALKITTIKPGFINTPLIKRKYPLTIELEKGGRLIFKAIEKKKRSVILPARWRLLVFVWRLIPTRIWERIF